MAVLLKNPRFSSTLWTKDIKGSGRLYMNRLVAGDTLLSVSEIEQTLKQMEVEARRTHDHVTIDLDLMQYDSNRYHLRDWPRPYISKLHDQLP
jgi:2-amino-4-hydroxy-6-hydroxymethyldihydropteridine diphosphokinase